MTKLQNMTTTALRDGALNLAFSSGYFAFISSPGPATWPDYIGAGFFAAGLVLSAVGLGGLVALGVRALVRG